MKRLISSAPNTSHGPRAGTFMIVAMICLTLTTALLGTLLKMAVLGRQHAQVEAAGLQAQWLAESALDRAAARLNSDAGYEGETWEIPAEEFDGRHAGRAVISIKPTDGNQRIVEVIALYPTQGPQSAKRTKRLVIGGSAPEAANAKNANPVAPATAEKSEKGGG